MELPVNVKTIIDEMTAGVKINHLREISDKISSKYKNDSGSSRSLILDDEEALVYSIVRMPATYAAMYSALDYASECISDVPSSLLDAGAGTGAATLAAKNIFGVPDCTCIEKETAMLKLGERFVPDAEWIKSDINSALDKKYDLVVAGYVLNELDENKSLSVLNDLWERAGKTLVILEPGTPAGFSRIKKYTQELKSKGAHVAAPCPDVLSCPIAQNDWCHFTCRISRSKLHKMIKNADVPYEDEKFSYVVFSRNAVTNAASRVLRHPYIEKGQISLTLCTRSGIKDIKVRKSDGERFRIARKISCGDPFPF